MITCVAPTRRHAARSCSEQTKNTPRNEQNVRTEMMSSGRGARNLALKVEARVLL